MDIFSSWHASGGEWRSFMFTIGVSSASMYLLLGFAVGWHMIPYADTPNHSQGPKSVPWNLKWTSLGHLHLIWSNLCILLNMEQLFDEYIYIYICIKLLSILGITPVVDNKGSRTVSSKAVSFVASSFNFKKKNTKTQQPGKTHMISIVPYPYGLEKVRMSTIFQSMSAANVHLLQGFQDAVGICLCNKQELVGESCDFKMDQNQEYVQPVRMVKTREKTCFDCKHGFAIFLYIY